VFLTLKTHTIAVWL